MMDLPGCTVIDWRKTYQECVIDLQGHERILRPFLLLFETI